jgi:peptidoglycan/LPS O-acetylase OafA/YrhL
MKEGLLERLSNLLGWGGFTMFFITIWVLLEANSYDFPSGGFLFCLITYICCVVINYLLAGNMRLLPWRDVEDQE